MKYNVLMCALVGAIILTGCGKENHFPTLQKKPTNTTIETTLPPIKADSEALYVKGQQYYAEGKYKEALLEVQRALEKDEKNYKALSLEGVILAMDGQVTRGLTKIEKSLTLAPTYTQAHYDMGIAAKLDRQYDKSITHFQKVIEKDPQNTWAYYGIATNYADKRNKNEALAYLQKAVALGKEEVKNAAKRQDHFRWLHDNQTFQSLTN